MSKIFISYRRKSWAFTHRLADDLREQLDADIFVDQDNIDQADFEKSIVSHLLKSKLVLLVVSETTFADRIHREDDWVRREIREALTHQIPLLMVCVEGLLPPSGLPDDIKEVARMQGINFYPEFFMPGVERLIDFAIKVAPIKRKSAPSASNASIVQSTASEAVPPQRTIGGKATLDEVLTLMDNGDFGKAIFLLEELRDTGYTSRFFDLNELLKQANEHHLVAERHRTAQLEYEEVVSLTKSRFTRPSGLKAFQVWSEAYPDLVETLDTEGLCSQLKSETQASPKVVAQPARNKVYDILPAPFEWIDIPAGKVNLINTWDENTGTIFKIDQPQEFSVSPFSVAKYPITSAQFSMFIKAGGYSERKWWTEAGWLAKTIGHWTEPTSPKFINVSDDFPVVGVSWHEALAYCFWLSDFTDKKIMLPTEQQWQRAAQGDDNRIYPWGNEWDVDRCNNSVGKAWQQNGISQVTKYIKKGDSFFMVTDMSGNIYEWCLTLYKSGSNVLDRSGLRVIKGGSWLSNHIENLRVDFRARSDPVTRVDAQGFRVVFSE